MFADAKAFSAFAVDDLAQARKFYGETPGVRVSEQHGLLTLHLAGGRDTRAYPKPDHNPAKTGVAFYMFGLILLPTLAFVGLATFHRVLQSGIEDLGYARRIAQLRGYYFDHAPELVGYLLASKAAPPADRHGRDHHPLTSGPERNGTK